MDSRNSWCTQGDHRNRLLDLKLLMFLVVVVVVVVVTGAKKLHLRVQGLRLEFDKINLQAMLAY